MLEKLKRMRKSALHRLSLAQRSYDREHQKFKLAVEEVNTIERLIMREKDEVSKGEA